jgi:tRNA-2-methylthio-N6-dimethylallyladenosine synthase
MRRGYTTELYRTRLGWLREAVPDLELGSDWIVGFPGESEADFAATLDFVRAIESTQNYVFQYSPRPQTRAHELPDDVPEVTKKARNQALLRASEEVAFARHQRHVGALVDVFIEERLEDGERVRGRSRHNLSVSLEGGPELVGRSVRVRVEGASAFGAWGSAEDEPATLG